MGEMPKESEKLSEPDLEKPEEKHEKTAKSSKTKETKQAVESNSATFPIEGKVNKYGFIYLDGDILAAWGLSKGKEQRIALDMTQDGALILRKV